MILLDSGANTEINKLIKDSKLNAAAQMVQRKTQKSWDACANYVFELSAQMRKNQIPKGILIDRADEKTSEPN